MKFNKFNMVTSQWFYFIIIFIYESVKITSINKLVFK